jgi:hypothetical protein
MKSCRSGFRLVDEKMHAVEEVDLTDTGIGVQEQQVEIGVTPLQAFLHAFGNDMIGDTAKWL